MVIFSFKLYSCKNINIFKKMQFALIWENLFSYDVEDRNIFKYSLWSHIWCFSASLNIHLFVIFHKWIGKKCRNFRLGFLKSTLILFIWPGYLLQEGGSTLWYEAYYKQTDKLLVIYCMIYTYTRCVCLQYDHVMYVNMCIYTNV